MTKSDSEFSTNQNLLEYNPNIISDYYKKCSYYSVNNEDLLPIFRDSYVQLICKGAYRNYKLKDSKNIISKVSRNFVIDFNDAVISIDKAKRDGHIGKYTKLCIKKKNGKNRIVYNPSPEFKKILTKFLKVLEYISFDKYTFAYRYIRVNKDNTRVTKCFRTKSGHKITQTKQVLPHKSSIDSVLSHISFKLSDFLTIDKTNKCELHKLDIKDAFQSTKHSIVRDLYNFRLADYDDIRKFIIANLEMCFIDGKLPPGYPTSSILFNFVKDTMLKQFRDKLHAIFNIDSYVDDLYLLVLSRNENKELAVTRFKKYLRKWGYRINKNKSKKIDVISSIDGIISLKFQSNNILGKYPKQGDKKQIYWTGSRRHKNKLRALEYILQKEKQNSGSSSDSEKDSEEVLKQKVNSFKDFYFPVAGSHTYRAMQ